MAKNKIDFSPTNPENAAMREAGAQAEAEDAPVVEEDNSALEVVVGPEEKLDDKPEVVTMTPEEFAKLRASSDSAKALRDGIEGLASRLAPQQGPMPVNMPQQTPEEFYAEHSDDLFDKEKGAKVLRQYTKLVSEQEYGPILQNLSMSLSNTRKELLEARDPQYKKYKTEVEQLVASQPPNVRANPDIFEQAWNVVRQRHQAEIEEETVNEKVSKALDAKLKELGIDPSKPAQRPAAHVNSEGRSVPQQSSGTRTRVRLPDEATRKSLEAEALRKGMELEDLLKIRGYIH
jgi:hypothetical protein